MTISKQACRLLHKAEELLSQPWAWTKGSFVQQDKRAPSGYAYCAVGALEEARRRCHASSQAKREAVQALAETIRGEKYPYATSAVTAFNDREGTRKKDVLDKFRETRERVGC